MAESGGDFFTESPNPSKPFSEIEISDGAVCWILTAHRHISGNLVLLALLLTVALSRLGTNLLVILLERGKVLASLAELTLLHTLTHIPAQVKQHQPTISYYNEGGYYRKKSRVQASAIREE